MDCHYVILFFWVTLYVLLSNVSANWPYCHLVTRFDGINVRYPEDDNDFYLSSEIECLSDGLGLSWNSSHIEEIDVSMNFECGDINGDNIMSLKNDERLILKREKNEHYFMDINDTILSKISSGRCTVFGCSVIHDGSRPDDYISSSFLYFRNNSCTYKPGSLKDTVQVMDTIIPSPIASTIDMHYRSLNDTVQVMDTTIPSPIASTIDMHYKSLLMTSSITYINSLHMSSTDIPSLKNSAEITTKSLTVEISIPSPMETSIPSPTSSPLVKQARSTVIVPTFSLQEIYTSAMIGDISNTVSTGTVSSYILYGIVTIFAVPVIAILLLILLLYGKKKYMRSKYLPKWKTPTFGEIDKNYTPVIIGKDNSKYESTGSNIQYLGLNESPMDHKLPVEKFLVEIKQRHHPYQTNYLKQPYSSSFKPSSTSSGYQSSSSPITSSETTFHLEPVFSDSDSIRSVCLESTKNDVHASCSNPLFHMQRYDSTETNTSNYISTVNYQLDNDILGDINVCGDTDSVILSDEDISSNGNRVMLTFSSSNRNEVNELSSAAEYSCNNGEELQFDTNLTESNLIINPDHFDPL